MAGDIEDLGKDHSWRARRFSGRGHVEFARPRPLDVSVSVLRSPGVTVLTARTDEDVAQEHDGPDAALGLLAVVTAHILQDVRSVLAAL